MEFSYFVVFSYSNKNKEHGVGNTCVILDKAIKSKKDIREIEAQIREDTKTDTAGVLMLCLKI